MKHKNKKKKTGQSVLFFDRPEARIQTAQLVLSAYPWLRKKGAGGGGNLVEVPNNMDCSEQNETKKKTNLTCKNAKALS